MKKSILILLAAMMILTCVIPVSAAENTVSISPKDSIADALASIKSGGTLVLGEGTYKISETISLDSAYTNITIKGEGSVTITGGNEVPFSSFKKCNDTKFLNALSDQSVCDSILTVNLLDLGIKDLGLIKPQGSSNPSGSGYAPTLTFNDKVLSMARYPNNGYVYTKTAENINGNGVNPEYGNHYKVKYTLEDKRYENWDWTNGEIWNTAYFYTNWVDTTTPAGKNNDGTLYGYTSQNYPAKATGSRLFFFNVPEEIDAPGEWYLNRKTGVLYLYPETNMKATDVLIYSSYNKNLFNLNDCKNITFENICFNGTCEQGIKAESCDGVVFESCEFTGIGSHAVYFKNCCRSGVRNCYFHDLGSYGVYFDTCGDKKTLTSGECFAYNSHFERFSQYRRTYSPGVHIGDGVGTHISHCKFNNAPHFAIRYDTNNAIIEYSEFSDVCLDTADAGAVYTGRQWATRGNEIRYNYFHDLNQNAEGDSIRAIYLDDCSSSTRVHGNVFFNVDQAALFAGGRYNQFTNNLLVNCKISLDAQSRGTEWIEDSATNQYVNIYNALRNSIQYTENNESKYYYFERDEWKEGYPEQCDTFFDDINAEGGLENLKLPKYNTIKNNILYASPEFTIADNVKTYGNVEQGYISSDPNLFENYVSGYLTLNKNSNTYKAMASDFEDIPFKEMGIIGKGPDMPQKIYVSRDIYTEDYVVKNNVDFPRNAATTTTGGTVSAYDYWSSTNTFDWKKDEGLLGIQRVSGKGDVNSDNKTGKQMFTVEHEVPMYKGSRYTLTHIISNIEELTSDRLTETGMGTTDYYSIWSYLTSKSKDTSPFTTANQPSSTKEHQVVPKSDSGFSYVFAEPTEGFGQYSDGKRPYETGSIKSFCVGLYFGDIMAYFDKTIINETTPYSRINIKQSLGGSATLSGYTVSEGSTARVKVTDKAVGNEIVILESYLTATLKFTPDEGKTPVVTYNDVPLIVNNNTVSFVPTEGGTLHIQYANSNPAVTSVTAGEPVHTADFETMIGGTTYSSAHSIIMYAMVNIGTGKTYDSSGYYVTKLDGDGNQVGKTQKLPAVSVPIGDTYAIRMIGTALTAGTYKLKPYLIVRDKQQEQQPICQFKEIDSDGATVYEIINHTKRTEITGTEKTIVITE